MGKTDKKRNDFSYRQLPKLNKNGTEEKNNAYR